MGNRPNKDIFDFNEKLIYINTTGIRICSIDGKDCLVRKNDLNTDPHSVEDSVFIKVLDDKRLLFLGQEARKMTMVVFDYNFQILQKSFIIFTPTKKPCTRNINVFENKKTIYCSIERTKKSLEFNYENQIVELHWKELSALHLRNQIYIDWPADNTIRDLLHVIRVDECNIGILENSRNSHSRDNKLVVIDKNGCKQYPLKMDGFVMNIYHDKFADDIIISYIKRVSVITPYQEIWWHIFEVWTRVLVENNEEWQFKTVSEMIRIPLDNKICKVFSTRHNYAIVTKNAGKDKEQTMITILRKRDFSKVGSFFGDHVDFYDDYENWFDESLRFLQKISVLSRMSVDVLKVILLYI